MKAEDFILMITAGLVIYLLNEKSKDQKKIANLNNQNNMLVNLANQQKEMLEIHNEELRKTIESKNLPEEIKSELTNMISEFDIMDKNLSRELISISSLIEIDEKPKAIFTMSKIIENLLKKIFNCNMKYQHMLERAKKEKIFTPEEFHFVNGIREIRNKEGHELNVKVEDYLTSFTFTLGIKIIAKLKSIPVKA